jgi:hypothetical protein
MNPESLDPLRALLRSPEGDILHTFLSSKALALDSIANVREMEHPFAQAVELQAQRKARKFVVDLMREIGVELAGPRPPRDPRDSMQM